MLTILLLLAMALVLLMALREIHIFRREKSVFKLRRLTLRMVTAALLLFLMLSILIGVRFFGLNEPFGVERIWILFWGSISLIIGGLLFLVLADFRTPISDVSERTASYWSDINRTIAEHQQKPKE